MAQEFLLNGDDYVHLKDRSCYNNNYYQHKETGVIIFEKCEEFEGTFAFYALAVDKELFLGRSGGGIENGVIIEIHPDWI